MDDLFSALTESRIPIFIEALSLQKKNLPSAKEPSEEAPTSNFLDELALDGTSVNVPIGSPVLNYVVVPKDAMAGVGTGNVLLTDGAGPIILIGGVVMPHDVVPNQASVLIMTPPFTGVVTHAPIQIMALFKKRLSAHSPITEEFQWSMLSTEKETAEDINRTILTPMLDTEYWGVVGRLLGHMTTTADVNAVRKFSAYIREHLAGKSSLSELRSLYNVAMHARGSHMQWIDTQLLNTNVPGNLQFLQSSPQTKKRKKRT